MKNTNVILLVFVSLLFFVSCKNKKVITQTDLPKKTTRFLLKQMETQVVNVDWLDAKAKIKFRSENEKAGATTRIRLKKDNLLWMNITKAGVEAFRVLITTDSVFIIDRLEKQYMKKGLDFVEKQFGVPADFNSIQTILLGNPLFISNKKPDSQIKDSQYYLNSEKDNLRSEYWLEGNTFRLAKMAFEDIRNDGKVSMGLEDYKEIDEKQKFSYFRELNMNAEETGDVEMTIKFSNVEINTPKSIKFDIPKRYKRVD